MELRFALVYLGVLGYLLLVSNAYEPVVHGNESVINVRAADLPSGSHYPCTGGLQVDRKNNSQLLIALCPIYGIYMGSIQALSVTNLSSTPTPLYDTVVHQRGGAADGDRASAKFREPWHMYQTSDGSIIYFVESKSCLREINRETGYLRTLLGEAGSCKYSTLDWTRQMAEENGWTFKTEGVRAMTYYEKAKTWFFAVVDNGLFTYIFNTEENVYKGRRVLSQPEMGRERAISFLLVSADIIWHKFGKDIHRYDGRGFNERGGGTLSMEDGTFKVQLSLKNEPTTGAIHWYHSALDMGPNTVYDTITMIQTNPDVMAISAREYIYVYNIETGKFFTLCDRASMPGCTTPFLVILAIDGCRFIGMNYTHVTEINTSHFGSILNSSGDSLTSSPMTAIILISIYLSLS